MAELPSSSWPGSESSADDAVVGLREPESAPYLSETHARDAVRRTRKPLPWWDRVKFLLGLSLLFLILVWTRMAGNPLIPFDAAARETLRDKWWIPVLMIIECIRQIHFLIAEHWSGYYLAWSSFFSRFDRFTSRFSPWTRYRLSRVGKWLLFLAALAVILGAVLQQPPLLALFQAPALFVQQLPMILQVVLIVAVGMLQFVAIFWFLSRGGVDTYMPDEIKTRFTDVWGQDQVLARVKENVLFLENPQEIESKGGYVPGGILLWGPPGTGKTLMAEAVAGETGKPYVFVDPGAFINMFFGVGVLKVKSLFRKLRKLSLRYGGVIVFFDEADTLGSRGGAVSQARQAAMADAQMPWDAQHGPQCNGRAFVSAPARQFLAEQDRQYVMPTGGGGRSFDGTLQALLTELSGLKKPRGFLNRVVRRALGMQPKPPPKYRILVMMATNMPDSLDPALLRPGRIDRMYRVGYPSKQGRIDTYRNYLKTIRNDVTDEQIEKLATISPYATGASIKDSVNEALVVAIREGRDVVNYADLIKAKSLKQHGLPDGGAYVDRERHSVALHEACHAVVMFRLQHTSVIDTATIERRGDVGGFVSPIPIEERFVEWRSEIEVDVMTFLASLAGERLFYDGDHTQGVGGDMAAATAIVLRSITSHAMGSTLRAFNVGMMGQSGMLAAGVPMIDGLPWEGQTAEAVEAELRRLYDRTREVLEQHRTEVLAVTHALETHGTLSGDDVAAVIEGTEGPMVDGRIYAEPQFQAELEQYHRRAVEVHHVRTERPPALPDLPAAVAASRASTADPE